MTKGEKSRQEEKIRPPNTNDEKSPRVCFHLIFILSNHETIPILETFNFNMSNYVVL
ncbi:hypothetical protein IC582_024442 [Cucumis melo]